MGIRSQFHIKVKKNNLNSSATPVIISNNTPHIISPIYKNFLKQFPLYKLKNGYLNMDYFDEYQNWINSFEFDDAKSDINNDIQRMNHLQLSATLRIIFEKAFQSNTYDYFLVKTPHDQTLFNNSIMSPQLLNARSKICAENKEIFENLIQNDIFEELKIAPSSPSQKTKRMFQITPKGTAFARLHHIFRESVPFTEQTAKKLDSYLSKYTPETYITADLNQAFSPGIVNVDEKEMMLRVATIPALYQKVPMDDDKVPLIGSFLLKNGSKKVNSLYEKLMIQGFIINNDYDFSGEIKQNMKKQSIFSGGQKYPFGPNHTVYLKENSDVVYQNIDKQVKKFIALSHKAQDYALPIMITTEENVGYALPHMPRWAANPDNGVSYIASRDNITCNFDIPLINLIAVAKTNNISIQDIEVKMSLKNKDDINYSDIGNPVYLFNKQNKKLLGMEHVHALYPENREAGSVIAIQTRSLLSNKIIS